MGWKGASMSILAGERVLQKRGMVSLIVSLENQFTDHVSGLSLSWQIL